MSEYTPETDVVREMFVLAVAETLDSPDYGRNQEIGEEHFDGWLAQHDAEITAKAEERIIKLLEEQGCDCHNPYCDKLPTAALNSLIALIKGENK